MKEEIEEKQKIRTKGIRTFKNLIQKRNKIRWNGRKYKIVRRREQWLVKTGWAEMNRTEYKVHDGKSPDNGEMRYVITRT